ncbi:hypothetical protein FIBSPDRAFT_890069 [Athelia psychrophila]|uniref:DUF6533 domain-containing protein n=1 Tax=Athelia psychrophila TaxID=1759441 RepID=A0A166L941_9AGAM|nr:hypothetical protein FIBSPDRAFT_890069 [Fibularhizoctonia sp. CBS 109695]
MLTESASSLLRAQNTIVYDYILTFNSEVNLIWGEPWKTLKVLFLLSRYLPFADTAVLFLYHSASSQSECRTLTLGLGILSAVGSCITEYIFSVRTWAMWGFNRKVGMVLATTYLACWLPNVVTTVLFVCGAKYLPTTPVTHGCNEASANSTLFLAECGMVIVYWLVLIGLMVAKGGSPYGADLGQLIKWSRYSQHDFYNLAARAYQLAILVRNPVGLKEVKAKCIFVSHLASYA